MRYNKPKATAPKWYGGMLRTAGVATLTAVVSLGASGASGSKSRSSILNKYADCLHEAVGTAVTRFKTEGIPQQISAGCFEDFLRPAKVSVNVSGKLPGELSIDSRLYVGNLIPFLVGSAGILRRNREHLFGKWTLGGRNYDKYDNTHV